MEQPVLETPRLLLRPVEAKDQQKVFEGFSNPEITKHMEITYATFEATAEQMEWYANNRQNGSGYAWVATLKEEPESFLGMLSMYNVTPKHKRAEIGYWLFPQHWNKGYTAEGFEAIIGFASSQLDLHRIAAEVEPHNYGSRKVLQKLGFMQEATLRDYEIDKNGNYLDLEIWSRLSQ